MAGGVDTQGSVLRPQPWAGESQHLQSCRSLCKPLPEPSPRGGSSTSSPIPTLLKPLQGDGATTEAPSQPSPSGRNTNCWPIPAFPKVKEFQLLAYPCLLQGDGVPTETPPDLSQGEGAPSKCLKHCEMGLPSLGEGWGGASVEGDSGAIAPGYASGSLLAHDKLEGATCHDVGVGDVVLLILLAVELDRLDVAVVGAAAVGLYGEGLAVGEGDVCAA